LTVDEKLITAIQNGDRKTILDLYKHTFNVLMGSAVRYKNNQEDQMSIVNNAFMKIISSIEQFKPGTAYFSWAKTIVQREIIDSYRKDKKYHEFFKQDAEIADTHFDVQPDIDDAIEAEELQKLLDQLPPATKLVFNLYAIDGYETKEIVETLDISYETVKWHIKEARKKLKMLLCENQIPIKQ